MFKSWNGQSGHSVTNGSPPLQHFFERSWVACKRNNEEIDSANLLRASAYCNVTTVPVISSQS